MCVRSERESVCVCVCVCACMRVCMHACVHVFVYLCKEWVENHYYSPQEKSLFCHNPHSVNEISHWTCSKKHSYQWLQRYSVCVYLSLGFPNTPLHSQLMCRLQRYCSLPSPHIPNHITPQLPEAQDRKTNTISHSAKRRGWEKLRV